MMECKSLFANGAVGGGSSTAAVAPYSSNLDKNLLLKGMMDGQQNDESKGIIVGS
jgi:hypothetical protein